jgi:hypothetical protein
MSGEPPGIPPDPIPPDPAGIGAGGPSPADGDPRPPAGWRSGTPDADPPAWDPRTGWDDEPGATGAWDGAGPWQGWPPDGDAGPWDAVQPRKGWPPSGGGPRGHAWRDRPAVRLGLLGVAAAVLALLAATLVRPGMPRERDSRPPAAATATGPELARAYAFALPDGWRDATTTLAPRFPGPRPDVVLVGPASAGSAANLSIVRTGAGPARPPLASLPGAALRQLHAAGARLVGRQRRLNLAGEPAVGADYALPRGGRRLQARQVACYHLGDLYLVTLTAEAGAFRSQIPAQDRLVSSWRWT